jgi:membrane-associated phospholipid phosphatase
MTSVLVEQLRSFYDRTKRSLISFDAYTAVIMGIHCVLALILYGRVPQAATVISQDVLIASAISLFAYVYSTTGMALFGILRRFYIIPVVWLMYDQVHVFVRVVHPVDYDGVLIAADRAMFGVDPTVWLAQFSSPVITEYLQLCYFLFYVLPIMQAVELYRRGDMALLDQFARVMTFCYYISYLLYFALPAVGPRFTLHEYALLNTELPGVLLTTVLRDFVAVGGGILPGAADPAAQTNRDCMPSGHTMMTLVNIALAFRFGSRFRWLFVVIGGSLVIATVYLRYHYVVDVVVGAVLVAVTMPLEPLANRAFERWKAGRLTGGSELG